MAHHDNTTPMVFGTNEQIFGLLDQSITRHFMSSLTDQNGKICAEYVWIGGKGWDLRSKARTLDKKEYAVAVSGRAVSAGPARAMGRCGGAMGAGRAQQLAAGARCAPSGQPCREEGGWVGGLVTPVTCSSV